jgi:hypothetical protein
LDYPFINVVADVLALGGPFRRVAHSFADVQP